MPEGRTPGATGAKYKPEVGDIVLVEKRGHGMIESSGRPGGVARHVVVTMRYVPTNRPPHLHNCLYTLDEVTLVLPFDAVEKPVDPLCPTGECKGTCDPEAHGLHDG